MIFTEYPSPAGPLFLSATPAGLSFCVWRLPEGGDLRTLTSLAEDSPERRLIQLAVRELDEYFSGLRREFLTPLDLSGATEFRKRVWRNMVGIAYGRTMSYSDLALLSGSPGGARGVGQACALNPVSIFIPCHRVVAADGSLHGYAGGLEAKRMLLDLESRSALPLWPLR